LKRLILFVSQSRSSTALLDLGGFNFVTNLITTPVYTTTSFGGNTFYFLTNPNFLIELKSRQTNKIKRFNNYEVAGVSAGTNVNHAESYIFLRTKYTITGTEDLANQTFKIGTNDFPLGYYDLTIYEMSTRGDYNPENALQRLYKNILDFYPRTTNQPFPQVTYKEYNNNDADNNAIYLTH